MMLKVQSGAIATAAGRAPWGAIQCVKGSPAEPSSSETRGQAEATESKVSRVDSSRNSTCAPQSVTIAARLAGVEDGASGATATPARSAPRNTTRYSTELNAQIAIESRVATPWLRRLAATRSMPASSSA